MTRKAKAVAETKQAIENLQQALITLRQDGASDAVRQPYLDALREHTETLQRLEHTGM